MYPYALAVGRQLVGDHVTRILYLQAAIGALGAPLIADAVRRFTSRPFGLLAGAVYAFYSMVVFFDLQILSESVLLVLGCLVVWLVSRGAQRAPLLLGAVIAAMSLARGTFAIMLVPCAIAVGTDSRARARDLALLLMLPLTVACATAAFHAHMTGRAIPFTYSAGYNAFVGNGRYATGTYVPIGQGDLFDPGPTSTVGGSRLDGRGFIAKSSGLTVTPAASDSIWMHWTLTDISNAPARAARLFVRKLGLLLGPTELPQILSAGVYAREGGGIGWPIELEFGVLIAFAVVGGCLGWRRAVPVRLIAANIALLTIATALFFVVDRYRVHLVPGVTALAASGVLDGMRLWRERRLHTLLSAILCLAVLLVGAFSLRIHSDPRFVEWDYFTTIGEAWLGAGNANRAIPMLRRATKVSGEGQLSGGATLAGRISQSTVYAELAEAYASTRDYRAAASSLGSSVALQPDAASIRVRYAAMLAVSDQPDSASAQFARCGITRDRAADMLLQEAESWESKNDKQRLGDYLRAAAQLAPAYEPAVIGYSRLLILSGALEAANARLADGARNGIDMNVVRAHQAWIALASGAPDRAARLVSSIPAAVREGDVRIRATLAMMPQARAAPASPSR